MKLPVTDEFLWDLYSFLEKSVDVLGTVFNPYPRLDDLLPDLKNPIFKKYRKIKTAKQFNKLIYSLKRNNYIKVKNLENKKGLMITKEGISKALKASFIAEGKRKRRDGKWAMIIFDIPQTHQKARNLLKSVLRNLGYKLLQQSVWVTPYDVSEKTEKLLQLHSLDEYVKIFLIEEV